MLTFSSSSVMRRLAVAQAESAGTHPSVHTLERLSSMPLIWLKFEP